MAVGLDDQAHNDAGLMTRVPRPQRESTRFQAREASHANARPVGL